MSLILLVIYNTSDKIITKRERKEAKSREAAARMVRENVQAREKWRSAKDAAKKHAIQLSCTFSWKQSKGIGKFGSNDAQKQAIPPINPSKKNKPGDLTKMIHSLDENPDNEMGFNLQIGDKNLKKNMPKGKQMHTRSQIFKYAYGQIEKEKVMQQQNMNLTFSGVISMATDNDIRCRPAIEVAFRDLTPTLKGSKKHLLWSVTGKLMPGHVAALMGPSGAGKTTFLNALSGKATGCEKTGLVLINGKVESIHAYKKIIGFVPQDDIVHGNLTVEENLLFGARCSYALFKMFDDLILLAKGGIAVYHGSVKKVEEYFSGLGINVPERVNPLDYFIDILEGMVKPPGVNVKQLPLKWMVHNGYKIPQDMLQFLRAADTSESDDESSASEGAADDQSISEELGNVKVSSELKKDDNVEHNFSKSSDLSNRRTPGVLQQYKYFIGRVGKQRLREARVQAVDFLILGLAGVCLGALAKMSDETFGAVGYTYTVIAVSLLSMIGALRSFQLEKLQYLRERASGMSSAAYFLSKDTIDHFNTVIKPLVYLLMFYFFNNPRSSFQSNLVILIALVYCVTGIGYTFAICFPPGTAQLWSALLPVVLTLIATQRDNPAWLKNLCYSKWALEAFVISNAERYYGVWLITRCGALFKNDYKIDDWWLSIGILIAYGVVFRFIAYLCMVTLNGK